ncbi:DnaJ-domain-containing protein, partial [Lentithecium fluviatile CBS 122367]
GAGAGAGAGAAGGGGEVKTSYYELLGVERTATDDEIKKGYRRKALELHPDRNYGDTDRTTALFADVQTAYQVLSDPQERAWYDAHEGDILRGAEGKGGDEHYEYNMRVTTAEEIARMMGKFRGSVDFSDSPNGFFGFVREAFEQLAREEQHAADYEGVSIPDYPSFGHRDDAYEDVVRNFYAIWNGFATVKTFAWMDVYRPSDAPDRRVRRAIEKENKKYREEGIREFNDAVRALVAFVRKRDPRYTPNTQSPEEAAKAQRAASQAKAAKARAANAAKLKEQEDAVPEWAKAREPDEVQEETEEESEEEHFECVACRKTFKSERQYDAHEKSKKHQKAVYALKRKMQKDNANLNLDEDITSSGFITPMSADGDIQEDPEAAEPGNSVENLAARVENVRVEDESTDHGELSTAHDSDAVTTQRKPHPNTNTASSEADSDDDDDEDDEYASREEIEARLKTSRLPVDHNEPLPPDPPGTEDAALGGKKLGAAAKKRAKRAAQMADVSDSDLKHRCAVCKAGFPSKTQLFQHIKDF